jgi:transposase
LDNAKSHNNELIKNAITKSGNEYLFAIPYTPKTNNPIEAYFNQIKTYMKKNRNVENYEQLEKNVENAIEKVKPENYKNYFQYAYGMNEKIEFIRKPSTRKRKLKIYK